MSNKKVQIKPVFVKTGNVRRFETLMDGLELSAGEGRLGLVYGRAGRGKTRTAVWYAAQTGCVFLRCLKIWRQSELGFLQALCRELGVMSVPHRKDPAFRAALDAMVANPKPVFIEEVEKLPYMFLEIIRDLSDLSAAPVVLIGEEELVSLLKRNRRVWSRTFRQMQFGPVEPADIVTYANQAAGLKLSAEVMGLLHQSSDGDFRLVKRDLINLVDACNANSTTEPDARMTKVAIKRALSS
jgi:hypothetical protein